MYIIYKKVQIILQISAPFKNLTLQLIKSESGKKKVTIVKKFMEEISGRSSLESTTSNYRSYYFVSLFFLSQVCTNIYQFDNFLIRGERIYFCIGNKSVSIVACI